MAASQRRSRPGRPGPAPPARRAARHPRAGPRLRAAARAVPGSTRSARVRSKSSRRETDDSSEPALDSARLRRMIETSRARSSPRAAGFLPDLPAVALEHVDASVARLPTGGSPARALARLPRVDVCPRSRKQHDSARRRRRGRCRRGVELGVIAGARRGGQQHHAPRSTGDRVNRRAAIGPDRGGVRFVDDARSHVTSSSGRSASGRFTKSCDAM